MKLIDSKTYLNLAKSFAGECQARTRYAFMAYGAQQEGYMAMKDVIDKVITQEFNHARMFYTNIQKASDKPIVNIDITSGYPFREKWNLLDNLKFASEDESTECERIYPEYANIAREEGFTEIADLFDNIAKIENCHKMLFKDLYTQMKAGKLYKKSKPVKWKCTGCGHEHTAKEAWEICPVCHAKQGMVMLILADNA